MTLTAFERRILINQYRILARIDPDNETDHKRSVEALEHGYTSEFPRIILGMSRLEDMPDDEQQEVRDILAMYEDILVSHGPSPDLAEHVAAKFHGFDGNNESAHLGFARYLTKNEESFVEVVKQTPLGKLNSHATFLPMYRRMLPVWKSIGRPPRPLTREEVDRIIRAADKGREDASRSGS